jgi:hypothetical protein
MAAAVLPRPRSRVRPHDFVPMAGRELPHPTGVLVFADWASALSVEPQTRRGNHRGLTILLLAMSLRQEILSKLLCSETAFLDVRCLLRFRCLLQTASFYEPPFMRHYTIRMQRANGCVTDFHVTREGKFEPYRRRSSKVSRIGQAAGPRHAELRWLPRSLFRERTLGSKDPNRAVGRTSHPESDSIVRTCYTPAGQRLAIERDRTGEIHAPDSRRDRLRLAGTGIAQSDEHRLSPTGNPASACRTRCSY